MACSARVTELEGAGELVIRFAGDIGDGMRLTGGWVGSAVVAFGITCSL